MSIELKNNQAALLLDIGADDSITLNVNAENMDGLAARLCIAMAKKLLADAGFQSELMDMVEDDEGIAGDGGGE